MSWFGLLLLILFVGVPGFIITIKLIKLMSALIRFLDRK